MGFFTNRFMMLSVKPVVESQSLSGWDGVFHMVRFGDLVALGAKSQSLSGWDGVFHGLKRKG